MASPKNKLKTAIFLGAGASASEGAPVQTDIFRAYFNLIKKRRKTGRKSEPKHEKMLKSFFNEMFDINFRMKPDNLLFPTFEEALGILDLADIRNESFRGFSNINFTSNSGEIKFLRIYLIFLMADIIKESLGKGTIHRKLINNLNNSVNINETTFITTNYDILCDNALLDLYKLTPPKLVDYGVDFINYKENTFIPPGPDSIKLFKLHGSLNWLYCPTCNNLRITLNRKAITYDLMVDPSTSHCEVCRTVYSPMITPPTFYKDFSRYYLNQVWNKAENELLNVEHIIFCGYSFPDADMHIKYLLKRIQKNRISQKKIKFSVVNFHEGKDLQEAKIEEDRYNRFLGKVNYTKFSFDDFATDPQLVLR